MKTHILVANVLTLVALSGGALLRKVNEERLDTRTTTTGVKLETSTNLSSINQVTGRDLVIDDNHHGDRLQPHDGDTRQPDDNSPHQSHNAYQYHEQSEQYDPDNSLTIMDGPYGTGSLFSQKLHLTPPGYDDEKKKPYYDYYYTKPVARTIECEDSDMQKAVSPTDGSCTDSPRRTPAEPCTSSPRRPEKTDGACTESPCRRCDESRRRSSQRSNKTNGACTDSPRRTPAEPCASSPRRPEKTDGACAEIHRQKRADSSKSSPQQHKETDGKPDDPHSRPSYPTKFPPPSRPPPLVPGN